MEKIAKTAMDLALERAGILKTGLFMMMHPKAIEVEGKGVFEYAIHEGDADVPSVKVRASVDVFNGDVRTEVSASGLKPWTTGS